MRQRFGKAFLICIIVLSATGAKAAPNLAAVLQAALDSCHHWGGEVDENATPERIKQINDGLTTDCKKAMKSANKVLQGKEKDSRHLGLSLRIVDICQGVNATAKKWAQPDRRICADAQPYFAKLSPADDPDAQSSFLSLCPEVARKTYKTAP